MAQHPATVIRNNNEKLRSFKSKENIHKKEIAKKDNNYNEHSIRNKTTTTYAYKKKQNKTTCDFSFAALSH